MAKMLEHCMRTNLGHMRRATVLMLLVLFPTIGRADVGNLGSVVATVFTLAAALWGSATLWVFLSSRRKLSLGKRLGRATLFFFSPVLALSLVVALEFFERYALGGGTIHKAEITREPMTVYGATFPPGSQAEYSQTGGFFGWHARRTLQHISSPLPVQFNNIRIDGFIFIPNNTGNTIRLLVSAGQTIDGWPCGETTVNMESGSPELKACFLAAPYRWHGKLFLEGSYVDLNFEASGA